MATRSTRRGALAAAAGMLLLAVGSAGAQTTISADSIRGILQQRIERGGAVGIVAGRITDGRTEVVAAGTSAAGAQPVDASTVFEIGSISKVFTTMLLADMVVRGEVSLEDPVSKYLPDSVRVPSRNGREITLLHLATASSGLPRLPTNMAPDDITNPYADYGVDELYAFLGSYTLPRDPGASYEYSNLGMGLLGHLLSLEAGKPYEALVIERILEPLAMTETRITPTPAMRERIAQGHSADLEPVANWTFDVIAPAGGWFSTVPDMLRFAAAALDPPASLARAFALAMEPRLETGTANVRIGLGWHVFEQNGTAITWHNGQTGGYHGFIGVDTERGTGAVVLANAATNIDDIGLHLLNPSNPVGHPPPPRATVDVPEDVLERYVGRYELAPQFHIEVTRENDVLYAQATNEPRFRLFAASPTRFFLRVVEAEIEFTVDAAGNVTGLVLHQGGRATPGRRLPGG